MLVALATALSALVAAHFELNEWLYAFTRSWERVQLDELPFVMVVLSTGLGWLAWRRLRHARLEVEARRQVEGELLAALADNRRLAQEHLRIQEEERRHLARELHDDFSQYLNAIKLDATALLDEQERGKLPETAARIIGIIDHMHLAASNIISRLRPVALDELGLQAALEHCIDQWRQRMKDTRLEFECSGDIDQLDDGLAVTIFRLVQESLTNILRHADARRATVRLTRFEHGADAAPRLELRIQDDGRGMPQDHPALPGHFGLLGMRERVELAGGQFRITSQPEHGVTILATLPLGPRP